MSHRVRIRQHVHQKDNCSNSHSARRGKLIDRRDPDLDELGREKVELVEEFTNTKGVRFDILMGKKIGEITCLAIARPPRQFSEWLRPASRRRRGRKASSHQHHNLHRRGHAMMLFAQSLPHAVGSTPVGFIDGWHGCAAARHDTNMKIITRAQPMSLNTVALHSWVLILISSRWSKH